MAQGTRSVSRGSLTDQIIKQLIDLIMSNELKPGDRLPSIVELTHQFGVSRTVVREAIGMLAAQGFLQAVHGSGTFVSPTDKWNTLYPRALLIDDQAIIDELMKARELIEPQLAFLAAQRASAADIAMIECSAKVGGSVAETVEFDVAFHMAVAQASHNEVLAIMLTSIEEFMHELRTLGYSLFPHTQEQSLDRHQMILDAVKRGDAEGGRDAMKAHLLEAHEGFLQLIKARQA